MIILVFSVLAYPVQAATDGTPMSVVAKGTVRDSAGHLVASDVWFTFKVAISVFTIHIGSNNADGQLLTSFTTYGSSGTINSMSGPVLHPGDANLYFMEVTALYQYGVSVTSITIRTTGIIVMDTGLGSGFIANDTLAGSAGPAPTPTTSTDSSWTGLLGATIVAVMLILGVLLLDRRRKVH